MIGETKQNWKCHVSSAIVLFPASNEPHLSIKLHSAVAMTPWAKWHHCGAISRNSKPFDNRSTSSARIGRHRRRTHTKYKKRSPFWRREVISCFVCVQDHLVIVPRNRYEAVAAAKRVQKQHLATILEVDNLSAIYAAMYIMEVEEFGELSNRVQCAEDNCTDDKKWIPRSEVPNENWADHSIKYICKDRKFTTMWKGHTSRFYLRRGWGKEIY